MKKQFNLEDWLKDKSQKVVTRCGFPVRIVCTDVKRKDYPILALVERDDQEEYQSFTKDGRFSLYNPLHDNFDLFIETADEVSEDERIKKRITLCLEECVHSDVIRDYEKDECAAWLEKHGSIAKLSEEEQNIFAKGVLTSCAMSFIDYLDAHKYEGKMCVSNGECEDIENAFHNAMWDRLHRYYCKYIEKQGEVKESTISQHEIETCKENNNSLTSEDEKIRKEIINYFQCQSEEEPTRKEIHNKWIAWLENIQYTIDHEKREGFHLGYKACLERQGEQEPEENKGNIGGISNNPEWGEDDEAFLDDILCKFEHDLILNKNEKDWLKSLRPQITWKPSDEQIKVCKEVYADILSAKGFCIGTVNSELNRLEEELKKKGE